MAICYHCKKGIIFGRRHTHHRGVAGGRWKKRAPKTQRIFKVNLQPVAIIEDGKTERIKLCNKCLKRIKKDITDGKKPFLQLAKLSLNQPKSDKLEKPEKPIRSDRPKKSEKKDKKAA